MSPELRRPAAVYDVFVFHAAADEPFVQGYLLARLGLAPERVLRLQTLELGEAIADEIERGVRSSRVTIVVLSSAFMDDRWAAFGEQLAAYASVARRSRGVLLPLLLEDCTPTMHVDSLVKLDFRDPTREAWDGQIARLRAHLGQVAAPEQHLACPYPGMRAFTESDAGRFFGRDAELDRIVRRLGRGEREICLIGASGSGKSSLIAAGLLPRLALGGDGVPRFLARILRPGERPIERLAAALEADLTAPGDAVGALLARNPPVASLLLVIDQLEELFAIAGDGARARFLDALRVLRADPRCTLVFALRADFYGSFMDSALWTDRQGHSSPIELGPLRGDSLRIAIERPARALDVYFQAELLTRLVDDADREPGALPLLQETLFQLWRKRRHRLLALADYHALSDGTRTGLAFAVKEHADDVLGALSDAHQGIAYRLLLRLVAFGEGRADTRRQQPRRALRSAGETAADFEAVLRRLVDNRLVTITGDGHRDVRVDLAHEILIHAWATFAGWIRTWRAHEQRRRELEVAAAAWRARGSGDGGLLDPVELAAALAWRDRAAALLGHTTDLAAFLAASELAQADALRRERARREDRNRLLVQSAQLCQETGRHRLIDAERPLEALPYLVAARQAIEASGGTPGPALRLLFAEATRNAPMTPPLVHGGAVSRAAFSSDGARIVTAGEDQTARIWSAATGLALSPPLEHGGVVLSAAFSPDGTRLITAGCDWTARIWDGATGEPVAAPLKHHAVVESAAFSPDGLRVVTASRDRTARLWDAITGLPLSPPWKHDAAVLCAVFSPGGTRIVTAGEDGRAWLRDAATGEPCGPPLQHLHSVVSVAFDAGGTRIVTASEDRTARVWDAATGEPLAPPLRHHDRVVGATFDAGGSRVVTASEDRTARIWDAATGEPLAPPLVHRQAVRSAAFSSDGARVVTASGDKTARIWDAATGEPLTSPLEHQLGVVTAAFSPGGTRVVTASEDRTARVWAAVNDRFSTPPLEHQAAVRTVAFGAGGTRVVTASADHTARIWDAATGKPVSAPLEHPSAVASAAFSPDGTRVVTAGGDAAWLWDAATGRPLVRALEHLRNVMSADFSPGGTRIVTGSRDGTARVWAAATGTPLGPPLQHAGSVECAAFDPSGARVVTASGDHTARVWDATTGAALSRKMEHDALVWSAAFSPDGTRVVTTSWDSTARIWDAVTGEPLTPPLEHQRAVWAAAFSPDGIRIVTASGDYTARIWHAATGAPLSPPLEHQDTVWAAAFSPDGALVVTGSNDHTARIWDAATGRLLSPPLVHRDIVRSAAFSPDGACIVTASGDGTARIWRLQPPAATLAEWQAIADLASPYVLASGVLSSRGSLRD